MAASQKINAGREFTSVRHHEPEGPTDPTNTRLPDPFVVLVVAGSRGIGLGTAASYVKAGASTVIITGRSQTSLDAAAQTLGNINSSTRVIAKQCDATSETEVVGLAKHIEMSIGRLDVLIVNVGVSQATMIKPDTGRRDWPWCVSQEAKYSDFVSIMNVNVNAVWLAIHSFMPLLEASKDGAQAIIAITSAAAHYVQSEAMALSYSLSKMAATRLIEHVHHGHNRNGITAFAMQPGGVKTDMASDVPEGKGWEQLLIDSPDLAGGVCVWLTKERREWLSGRYIDARWDMDEMMSKREEIVAQDLLKFRMDF